MVFSNGSRPASSAWKSAGGGSFETASDLIDVTEEVQRSMTAYNMSVLWNGSWNSVAHRIMPSGFLPTSVSGGYGGITQQFVRDASGQLLGLLELGATFYDTVKSAMRFMLSQLQRLYKPGYYSYAPHVMHANKALDTIESCDTQDQTDDTFYLVDLQSCRVQ